MTSPHSRRLRSALHAVALSALLPALANAATLLVCRAVDMAAPPTARLVVPAGSLFRDDGRADDPMAQFGNDRLQLRLETIADVVIPPLQACAGANVRITSDSSVKFVSVADNRNFVYAGSNVLIDRPEQSEEILTLRGRVLDQVR